MKTFLKNVLTLAENVEAASLFPGAEIAENAKLHGCGLRFLGEKSGCGCALPERNPQPATFVENPYACVGAYAYLYI